jgi:hypothetical protein
MIKWVDHAPSEVKKFYWEKNSLHVMRVFESFGDDYSDSSTGAIFDKKLFVSSVFDFGIYVCFF